MTSFRSELTLAQAAKITEESTEEVSTSELCKNPIITVCIITFNHRPYIEEAMRSVLAQETDFEVEYIIGDDCSTDGTTQVVLDYQNQYPEKIRVLLAKENLGRHTGNGRLNLLRLLWASRGRYIALLEGDDYWKNARKLQRQFDQLESHPEAILSVHDAEMLSNGHSRNFGLQGDHTKFHLDDILDVRISFHTATFTFRRQLVEQLPADFIQHRSGDFSLLIRAALLGPILRIPEVMSIYRRTGKGVTANPVNLGISFHRHRIEMHQSFLNQFPGVADSLFQRVIRQHRILAWRSEPLSKRYRLRNLMLLSSLGLMPFLREIVGDMFNLLLILLQRLLPPSP